MSYFRKQDHAFSLAYLNTLQGEIQACNYLAVNNLNRDFVNTKGFSVVFRRSHIPEVIERFPHFQAYLDTVLQPDCNAFYLNPLLLQSGSRVEPHIDRSLRSYCKTINPPQTVSVLYIQLPPALEGGELVLRSAKRQVGQIRPQVNSLVYFQGDLTHAVNEVKSRGIRMSLVCEQYALIDSELRQIPELTIESRALKAKN